LDVYANLKKQGRNTLLAVCDRDLLGRELRHGNVVFQIRETFYKGALVNLEEAIGLVKQSTIVNMVGRRIVRKAIEEGLVHPDAVLKIQGVPHAQIVKV
jgi:hypothetical protein